MTTIMFDHSDAKSSVAPPVAILGSRSFVGSHLLSRLREESLVVAGYDSGQCNLLEKDQVKSVVRCLPDGSIFVLAATINKYIGAAFSGMMKNLEMVNNVIEALRLARPSGVIFLSSADVYGLTPSCPITELSVPRPSNHYGLSKLASEYMLSACNNLNCPVTILRLPGVYGPFDGGRSIVSKFLKLIVMGQPITIHGDGTVLRDYLFVNDLCNLILATIKKPSENLFNAASGKSFALKDIISLIELKLQKQAHLSFRKESQDAAGNLVFDTAKLAKHYPDVLIRPVDLGIQAYLNDLGEIEN